MKHFKNNVIILLILTITTMHGMKKHSINDNYKLGRQEFFKAIKEYDVDQCKELLQKYKDVAHTQCEIKHENGQTHYFPLWYLLSLEKENDDNTIESKLELVDLILKNTTDIKWAYDSLYWSLETICGKKYQITKFTVSAMQKAIEHFSKQTSTTEDDALKKIASKFRFNLSMFALNFEPSSESEISLYTMVNKVIEKN